MALWSAAISSPHAAKRVPAQRVQPHSIVPYSAHVTEVARSVDLTRGEREWLVLTVEVTAAPKQEAALRRLQPLREQFRLEDGAHHRYECAWLKGGTAPENAAVLRFRAGFPMPAPGVRRVSLQLLLPRPLPPRTAAFRFRSADLARLPATVETADGAVTVQAVAEQPYEPPSLPPGGRYTQKGTPVDLRVLQRPLPAGEKPPVRALVVSWHSRTAALFDLALDVEGSVLGVDGKTYPLLSARLERFPSRASPMPDPPWISAGYWFRSPPKGAPRELLLSFTLRAVDKKSAPVRIENLPVPGQP